LFARSSVKVEIKRTVEAAKLWGVTVGGCECSMRLYVYVCGSCRESRLCIVVDVIENAKLVNALYCSIVMVVESIYIWLWRLLLGQRGCVTDLCRFCVSVWMWGC
jgi:hypothetical protein